MPRSSLCNGSIPYGSRTPVRLSVGLAVFAFTVAAPPALADKFVAQTLSDLDLLDNGHLLVTDAGQSMAYDSAGVYEIDRYGNIVWSYTAGLRWAHNADFLPDGSMIISNTGHNQVIIIDRDGNVVWDTDAIALSDGSDLRYPNDANIVPNGNRLITDRDNHRVFECDENGAIVWQFGVTGVAGRDGSHLFGPHNADRLDNGNTIICDSNNNRILEVAPDGAVVWSYAEGLSWPRDADRLDNGNTLINDSNHKRLIEVTPAGDVVWEHATEGLSYDSDRLANGHTLYNAGQSLYEVDLAGRIVWQYPAPFEQVWVLNPTSGVRLFCNIHRPTDFNPDRRYPGIVLVPGGFGDGRAFLIDGQAQRYADLGFIVMRFDPDGRGLSTNNGTYTEEDYNGYIQQDGLRAVAQYLADLPETDDANIGIFTFSYGITMGAGTVARYPQRPPVKFLIEWEGPSDRSDTNGQVEHDVLDDVWWYEREPINFVDDFNGYFLAIQSEIDHVQPDNEHTVLLNNLATHIDFGGSGRCLWTRVNSQFGITNNDPNTVYDPDLNPPDWIPEGSDVRTLYDEYLLELADSPAVPLRLETSALVRGQNAQLTARDCMPGRTVFFVYSFAGAGSTYIAKLGIELDLSMPISLAGYNVADETGMAQFSARVPSGAPLQPVWLQAAHTLPGGGALKSGVVQTAVTE